MKQGLSLRVSQHLALTPQLQQSIRLLQLSTLELSQEIEQMLDENPFLDKDFEEAPREEFGLDKADAPARDDDSDTEPTREMPTLDGGMSEISVDNTASDTEPSVDGVAESWEGDGSVEFSADDSEWGGDAPASNHNNTAESDTADATELARMQESLASHLHRQALALRLSPTDQAALRYLIENLNDDGYLEDSLRSLAEGLGGDDEEEIEELAHRFQVALSLLQNLEPVGVGARDLAECLTLQLQALAPSGEEALQVRQTALLMCKQPMEMLAKRDFKRLAVLVGDSEAHVKVAIALIGRLEPKPGRRFADVERHVVVPDVLVTRVGKASAAPKFKVALNPDVMPRLRVHDIYANALRGGKGEAHAGLQQRLQEARWFIKNIQQRFDTILRVSNAIAERQKNFFIHGELAMRPMYQQVRYSRLGCQFHFQ